jgi:hypothetical protein
MTIPLHSKLAAEAFGTFCLVFAGTAAIVVDGTVGGAGAVLHEHHRRRLLRGRGVVGAGRFTESDLL